MNPRILRCRLPYFAPLNDDFTEESKVERNTGILIVQLSSY